MTTTAAPLLIGHRGAPGYRPEHTRASFELAFAQGADAVEPDLVSTRDGILIARHENEISSTTDVASRPDFAHLRTTKEVDGIELTGWFTEDFTWDELSGLRARERLPELRRGSTAFDGQQPVLRLSDVVDLVERQSDLLGRELTLVAELKHAQYFESLGHPLDELLADQIAGFATSTNLVVESFEQPVLDRVRARRLPGRRVLLVESESALETALRPVGGVGLRDRVHGVSVAKAMLQTMDASANVTGTNDLVARLHAERLLVWVWTLRAENAFLPPNMRHGPVSTDFGDWLTEFTMLVETGADGFFADQPDLLAQALGRAERAERAERAGRAEP